MKSFFILLVSAVTLVMVLPVVAAPNIGLGSGGTASNIANKGGYETAGVTDTTLSESVGKIIKFVLTMVGTIFMGLTVYAGFLWMTASGNDEQVTKAKGILRMAIIGLVIVLSSYGTTVFVIKGIVDSSSSSVQVGGSN